MPRAAITVNRPREEIEQRWRDHEGRPSYVEETDAAVRFADAPGGRGTEIHVDLEHEGRGGKLGEVVRKLTGSDPVAKVKDDLRRFKQEVETGVIPRSDATPEGESLERKLDQRPAQPLADSETEEVGV
ncbi:MAG TPA: hypothetical protein VHF58_02000 [Solirubrobacterales bacterium]|nr:hypothetical protein [Solirubrobacterales bacterium]